MKIDLECNFLKLPIDRGFTQAELGRLQLHYRGEGVFFICALISLFVCVFVFLCPNFFAILLFRHVCALVYFYLGACSIFVL